MFTIIIQLNGMIFKLVYSLLFCQRSTKGTIQMENVVVHFSNYCKSVSIIHSKKYKPYILTQIFGILIRKIQTHVCSLQNRCTCMVLWHPMSINFILLLNHISHQIDSGHFKVQYLYVFSQLFRYFMLSMGMLYFYRF